MFCNFPEWLLKTIFFSTSPFAKTFSLFKPVIAKIYAVVDDETLANKLVDIFNTKMAEDEDEEE